MSARGFVLRVVLVVVVVLGIRDWINPFNDRAFSSPEWKRLWSHLRAPMVEDLMENSLVGVVSREELQDLLGEPEGRHPAGYTGRHPDEAVETWIYDLGYLGMFAPGDDSQLYIHLDPVGAVVGSEIGGV